MKKKGGAGARRPAVNGKDADTRQQIVDVAQSLFLTGGYEGTGVKAIADKVGITTPALYWHFPSKQDIYLASMEQSLSQFLTAVHEAVSATEPAARLREYVRAHVTFQLDQSEQVSSIQPRFVQRAAIRALPKKAQNRIVKAQRGYLDEIRDVLKQGEKAKVFDFEDLTVTAFGVITLCEYPYAWYDPAGTLSIAEVAELYENLALGMVGYGRRRGRR